MKMLDLLSEHNLAKQDVKGLSPKNALKISWLKICFFALLNNFEVEMSPSHDLESIRF